MMESGKGGTGVRGFVRGENGDSWRGAGVGCLRWGEGSRQNGAQVSGDPEDKETQVSKHKHEELEALGFSRGLNI